MAEAEKPRNDGASERAERIQLVLDECLRRRAAGEELPEEAVIAQHPELMPELAERLWALKLIEAAGRRANGSGASPRRVRHIRGTCPHCQTPWQVSAEHAGHRVRCRDCGEVFVAEPAPGAAGATPEALPASAPPTAIPGYQIEKELGQGGMGRVYLARELSTKRQVAVKVMLPSREADQRRRRRFEREVEIAASLQHPNIARLYASGLHEGRYWFAMEYVQGERLDRYVDRWRVGLKEVLGLFARVCGAVNHAHQRGVLHRDLKPSNILVDERGQPHVLDFGLAKLTEGGGAVEETISVEGQAAGTPQYMSPEQVEGDPERLDIRSDVYSLGVMMYQVLTGESPYGKEDSLPKLFRAIAEGEPVAPRRVRKEIPEEVSAIILKAMEKDPGRRYQSAGEMGRDLEAYLRGEAVTAKQGSAWYMLRKTAARYRVPAGIIAGVVVLSLGLGLAMSALFVRTQIELREVVRDRDVIRERIVYLEREVATAAVHPPSGTQPVASSSPSVPLNILTDAERAAGWRLLFDGMTTAGWRAYRGDSFPVTWKVVDGALAFVGPSGADIVTTDEYEDFELALEFRVSAQADGGIMFRVSEGPSWAPYTGPEMQIVGRDSAGLTPGRGPTGACCRIFPPSKDASLPDGQWNKARVLVNGSHVEHWVNGDKVLQYELGSQDWKEHLETSSFRGFLTLGKNARGLLCLQGEIPTVEYRNLKVRALPGGGFEAMEADGPSFNPEVSPDGRFVVFESMAGNLVPRTPGGSRNLFLHDRLTGRTEQVNVDSNARPGKGWTQVHSNPISLDGRYVVFTSDDYMSVPEATHPGWQVFARDRVAGRTEFVSVSFKGTDPRRPTFADLGSISSDGRYITFQGALFDAGTNQPTGQMEVFFHDRITGRSRVVSATREGEAGNMASWGNTVSADGRLVAFHSHASNLARGDTNGKQDVFVWDAGTGEIERVSVSSRGEQGNEDSASEGEWRTRPGRGLNTVAISSDGRYVAFHSDASNLVGGDTNGKRDVFVHDRQTRVTERVSVGSGGQQGNGRSLTCAISGDGRHVGFSSEANNLVPGFTNAEVQVYVRDRIAGKTECISVNSDGQPGDGASWFRSMSADGRYVAFHSAASNLVPGDTNGCEDVFVHDRLTHKTERVSIGSRRRAPSAPAREGREANGPSFQPTISADGRSGCVISRAGACPRSPRLDCLRP